MHALLILTALSGPPADDDAVERGRYLVHHVAMCVQCHSPRDRHGVLVGGQLLHGASIPLSSPWQKSDWAFRAPRLAGLPGLDPAVVKAVLMTGRRPDGYMPQAPMPPFRLGDADADAVIAYLASER